MELVGFVMVLVLAYVIFLGIKFTNFKSKLMNEFGRRGVPFELADSIFFNKRDAINSLHHSGMPIDQIVDRCLAHAPSSEALSPGNQTGLSSKGKIKNDQKRTNNDQALIEFVSGVLGIQAVLFVNEDETLPEKALDEWSIGYVAGTADAVLQKNGIGSDVDGLALMTLIFIEVFGQDRGPSFFGKFMRLQEQGNQAVQNGMETGGRDIFGWMANNDKVPTGWLAHVHGIDKA